MCLRINEKIKQKKRTTHPETITIKTLKYNPISFNTWCFDYMIV